jgi:hypothetical protein
MSKEQQSPQLEEQEFTGRIFENCTFNGDVNFNGNVFIDSYGYRNIGDVLRLQEQRLQQLQQQASTSAVNAPPTTGSSSILPKLSTSKVASEQPKSVKPRTRKVGTKKKVELEDEYQLVEENQDE